MPEALEFDVVAKLEAMQASLTQATTIARENGDRAAKAFEAGFAGLKFAGIVGGLKGAFGVATSIVAAFKGDFEAIWDGLQKLPFGMGAAVGEARLFYKELTGAKEQAEAIAKANAESKKSLEEAAAAAKRIHEGTRAGGAASVPDRAEQIDKDFAEKLANLERDLSAALFKARDPERAKLIAARDVAAARLIEERDAARRKLAESVKAEGREGEKAFYERKRGMTSEERAATEALREEQKRAAHRGVGDVRASEALDEKVRRERLKRLSDEDMRARELHRTAKAETTAQEKIAKAKEKSATIAESLMRTEAAKARRAAGVSHFAEGDTRTMSYGAKQYRVPSLYTWSSRSGGANSEGRRETSIGGEALQLLRKIAAGVAVARAG